MTFTEGNKEAMFAAHFERQGTFKYPEIQKMNRMCKNILVKRAGTMWEN